MAGSDRSSHGCSTAREIRLANGWIARFWVYPHAAVGWVWMSPANQHPDWIVGAIGLSDAFRHRALPGRTRCNATLVRLRVCSSFADLEWDSSSFHFAESERLVFRERSSGADALGFIKRRVKRLRYLAIHSNAWRKAAGALTGASHSGSGVWAGLRATYPS